MHDTNDRIEGCAHVASPLMPTSKYDNVTVQMLSTTRARFAWERASGFGNESSRTLIRTFQKCNKKYGIIHDRHAMK